MSSVNQSLSLFIPRVFANISQQQIADIIYNSGLGVVKKIDRVLKRDSSNGNEYYSAYIHFDCWFDTDTVARFQKRVVNPEKEARIVYNDPWYWIVLENKGTKRVPGQRKLTLTLDKTNDKTNDNNTKKNQSVTNHQDEFPDNFDLVDAAYAEYYEVQLGQEQAKVEHLETELWNMQQELISERQANYYLTQTIARTNAEIQTLQEELARTFKPIAVDNEMGATQTA
jgi:hypothetical protein